MNYNVLECNVDDISKGGVYALVSNVIKHNNDKNKVIDIASIAQFEDKADIEELKGYNCNVYFVGSKKSKVFRLFKIYRNTKRLLLKNKYNCVHIHSDTSYTVFPFLLAAKKANVKKIIVHSHASGLDGSHRKIKYFLHKLFKNYVSNNCTDLVACSDVAGNWMFNSGKKNQIKIINNGIDLESYEFNPSIRTNIRKHLKLEDKVVVGNVGRLAYQKNHKFLITVFKKYHKLNPSSVLLLVGEGPLKSDLKSFVKEMNLEDSVIFYGTSQHVNDLLQAMDVFALTSYFEGLSIAGVEAQASGLPTVFSNRITKSAKLIDNCSFLSITDNERNIHEWVKAIDMYSKTSRVDELKVLKQKGYSIHQTVDSFLRLYE